MGLHNKPVIQFLNFFSIAICGLLVGDGMRIVLGLWYYGRELKQTLKSIQKAVDNTEVVVGHVLTHLVLVVVLQESVQVLLRYLLLLP